PTRRYEKHRFAWRSPRPGSWIEGGAAHDWTRRSRPRPPSYPGYPSRGRERPRTRRTRDHCWSACRCRRPPGCSRCSGLRDVAIRPDDLDRFAFLQGKVDGVPGPTLVQRRGGNAGSDEDLGLIDDVSIPGEVGFLQPRLLACLVGPMRWIDGRMNDP